jgi:DNA-binding transcriptional MocR family regulator
MEHHDVSRNTVRLALGALTTEGLIGSSQGRGSFDRERTPLQYFASRIDSFARRDQLTKDALLSDAKEQAATAAPTSMSPSGAPPELATRLQLDDDAIAIGVVPRLARRSVDHALQRRARPRRGRRRSHARTCTIDEPALRCWWRLRS